MSSNGSEKVMIASSEVVLSTEIQSSVKEGKVIIPFGRDRFSCRALQNEKHALYFDLSNYQKIEEYCPDDKILTVQCGIKIQTLNEFLLQQKQWLPLSYCDQNTSLLELILTGGEGPYEALFGGLRRHLLGLRSLLSTGQVIKSGGRVVKNVSGYDLTRFLIGSYGYFAIPLQAHLKLYALPQKFSTMLVESDSLEHLLTFAQQVRSSHVSLAYVEILESRLLEKALYDKERRLVARYILALQIYGDTNFVEEGAQTIKDLASQAELATLDMLLDSQQIDLAQTLTQITTQSHKGRDAAQQRTVNLLVNGKDCFALLFNKELSSFPFIYRPISQKLHFCLHSDDEQTRLLELLTAYAKKLAMPISVAYSNDNYMRVVRKIGVDATNGDTSLEQIKQAVKSQFDPADLFNPFVKL